jgi:chemotaxis methyl-accepting protein methylase
MEFDQFLKETSSLLGLQWQRFQRRGIRRKIEHRLVEVGLGSFEEYSQRIKEDPQEKGHLSKILTVTISRFFRDQEVFNTIETSVFPALLKENPTELKLWSMGCASGEEPYSLCLLWKARFENDWPQIHFSVLATDIDESLLERAKEGRYKKSSLREVPQDILGKYFRAEGDVFLLEKRVGECVEFQRHDILREEPFSGMDLVFCRNLTFTYFSRETQIEILKKIFMCLGEQGSLVTGSDESIPLTYPTLFTPVFPKQKIFRKLTLMTSSSSR